MNIPELSEKVPRSVFQNMEEESRFYCYHMIVAEDRVTNIRKRMKEMKNELTQKKNLSVKKIRRVIPAVKTAHAFGCDLRIVSDANMFYIETILKHLGLMEYFSEINTNPGFVDEQGRLRIQPYHDFHTCSNGCTNPCPLNMCKGMIIERIQSCLSSERKKKKIIYLGDGAGDFCPSLKLKEGDYMMPRKNFPVRDLICKNREFVKAEIHEWSDGEELEIVLIRLIDTLTTREEDRNEFAAANLCDNCKFQTMTTVPMVTPGALPMVLVVPH